MGDVLVYPGCKGEWLAIPKHSNFLAYHPHMRKVILPFIGWYGKRILRGERAFYGKTPFEAMSRCRKAMKR